MPTYEDFVRERNIEIDEEADMEKIGREYESQVAKELYDRSDIKKAGQDALSKVSNLLIRYNRLKDAEKKRNMDNAEKKTRAEDRRKKRLEEVNEKRTKIVRLQDEKQKEKELEKIKELEKSIQDDYDEELRKITQKSEKAYMSGLIETIDDDATGGILSTLMLGGNAMGSEGYMLTSGNEIDLMKGGDYIKDVTGENGSFLSQMALLDNAVNTSGIDIEKDENAENEPVKDDKKKDEGSERDWFGSSARGAQYSLGDILRDISDSDVTTISNFTGENMTIDMEALKEERENGGLDDVIGAKGPKKSINEAIEEKVITQETKERIKGKRGGANELSKAEQKELIKAAKGIDQSHGILTGFFRDNSGYRKKKRGSAERRAALRAERMAWQAEMNEIALSRSIPVNIEENENDTSDKMIAQINAIKEQQQKQDELRRKKEEAASKKNGENVNPLEKNEEEALLQAGNKDKDKSVRNMIAAYRLLGATPKELYKFRLALIAYMIPTGKKTLLQILKESEEAGFKGNEDISTPKKMYTTFMDAPIVEGLYVNNAPKKKKKINEEENPEKDPNNNDKDNPEKKDHKKYIDEEQKKLEATPLGKALLAHFEIVGKNVDEREILETFKQTFFEDHQNEIFNGALLPQEIEEIKNNIESIPNYNVIILRAIRKLR